MNHFELEVECPACNGTGVFVGSCEREGAAVICKDCNGTGKYTYVINYNEFTGKKVREGIKRVYKTSSQYYIAPRKILIERIGEVDFSKEGVSYEEFLTGKIPEEMEIMECPMTADRSACHDIKGFVKYCIYVDKGLWEKYLYDCKNFPNRAECWKRFKEGKK